MARGVVETSIHHWGFRSFPPQAVAPVAEMLERSGVVDYLHVFDILSSWWPRALWTPENTPLAEAMPDPDSLYDPAMLLGIAAASVTDLGLALNGTNACRQGPAEVMRLAMTLAAATGGKTLCGVGAGEAYNVTPFGYRRSEGLARLEDHFKLFNLLWECDGPIDFDGNVWKVEGAYLGTIRPEKKPPMWALGAGPKLIDIAARYADGWITAVPISYSTPERYAQQVQEVRAKVEGYGRDPDAFGFGIQVASLIHDDPAVIERCLDNPIMAFYAAVFGRTNQADWDLEGIEPVFPRNWNYSVSMLPNRMSRSEIDAINGRVPRAMVEKAWAGSGSAEDVASTLREYIEAGATLVCPYDLAPLVTGLADGPASLDRLLTVCKLVKG